MSVWQRMEKVSRTKHRTNEEVLYKVKGKISYGYGKTEEVDWSRILRGDSLLRIITIEGKRWRGGRRGWILVDWNMMDGVGSQASKQWRHWTSESVQLQRP